jgi:hypothetical protein
MGVCFAGALFSFIRHPYRPLLLLLSVLLPTHVSYCVFIELLLLLLARSIASIPAREGNRGELVRRRRRACQNMQIADVDAQTVLTGFLTTGFPTTGFLHWQSLPFRNAKVCDYRVEK